MEPRPDSEFPRDPGFLADTEHAQADDDMVDVALDAALRSLMRSDPGGDLPAGTMLADRYRLDDVLGRGGMGIVYAATDLVLERQVALKILRSDLGEGEDLRSRFGAEVRLTAGLFHPNILTVHDARLTGPPPQFLVMARCEGETLADRLVAPEASVDECDRWLDAFRTVVEAVAHAHASDVVHRDLKPRNLMLAEHGRTVVLDWGLATRVGDDPVDECVGTRMYMAPECRENAPPRATGDVYSLGVILREILDAADGADTRWGVDAAGELRALADRCTEAEPARRPQHAGEISVELDAWTARLRGRNEAARREVAIAHGLADLQRRGRLRTRRWAIATITALVIASGVGWAWRFELERGDRERRGALARAELAVEVAASSGAERDRWLQAAAVVEAVAEQLTDSGAGDELRRARALLARSDAALRALEEGERRELLARRLADSLRAVADRHPVFLDPDGRMRAYERAFVEAGVDLRRTSDDRTIELLGQLGHSAVFASALSAWAQLLPAADGAHLRERLAGLAARLDAAAVEVWAAVEREDVDALDAWLQQVDLDARASVEVIEAAARVVDRADPGRGRRLLRQLWLARPEQWRVAMATVVLALESPIEPTAVEWREVESMAQACLSVDDRTGVRWNLLGVVSQRVGKLSEAVEAFDRALAEAPGTALFLLNRATALRGADRIEEAVRAASQATALDPESGLAWHVLGSSRLQAMDWQGALQAAERATALAPRLAPAWHLRINAARRLQSDAMRRAICAEGLEHLPGEPTLLAELAYELALTGDIAAALERIAEIPDELTDSVRAIVSMRVGQVLARSPDRGALDRAEAAIAEAAQLEPSNGAAWYALGMVRMQLGDRTGALVAQRRATESRIYGNDAEAWAQLALTAVSVGESELAGDAAQRAIDLDPGLPYPRLALARSQLNRADFQAARQTVDAALARFDGPGFFVDGLITVRDLADVGLGLPEGALDPDSASAAELRAEAIRFRARGLRLPAFLRFVAAFDRDAPGLAPRHHLAHIRSTVVLGVSLLEDGALDAGGAAAVRDGLGALGRRATTVLNGGSPDPGFAREAVAWITEPGLAILRQRAGFLPGPVAAIWADVWSLTEAAAK